MQKNYILIIFLLLLSWITFRFRLDFLVSFCLCRIITKAHIHSAKNSKSSSQSIQPQANMASKTQQKNYLHTLKQK